MGEGVEVGEGKSRRVVESEKSVVKEEVKVSADVEVAAAAAVDLEREKGLWKVRFVGLVLGLVLVLVLVLVVLSLRQVLRFEGRLVEMGSGSWYGSVIFCPRLDGSWGGVL